MIEVTEADDPSASFKSSKVIVLSVPDEISAPAPTQSAVISEQPGLLPATTPIRPSTLEPYATFQQVIPCCALGCCAISFFPVFPEGFGCGSKCWTCCLLNETIICKEGGPRYGDHWIIIGSLCNLTRCYAQIKNQSQFFCVDFRLSIPWNATEMPFIFNICFLTMYFNDHWTASCCNNGSNLVLGR